MKETPFYINDGRANLFAIHHEAVVGPAQEGFVFCHPFAEEKLWAHRVFVSFARQLANNGYSVLRFDSTGYGDSAGEFCDADVATYLDDVERAMDELKVRSPELSKISLLGLRLGGTYAALVAERRPDVHRIVLWEPVTDGDKYMQEVLRSCLTTQLSVYGKITKNRKELVEDLRNGNPINVEGYDLCQRMFDQISNLKLGDDEAKYKGRALIIQIGKNGQNMRKEYESLKSSYAGSDFDLVSEEPFWREIRAFYANAHNLFERTTAWLSKA